MRVLGDVPLLLIGRLNSITLKGQQISWQMPICSNGIAWNVIYFFAFWSFYCDLSSPSLSFTFFSIYSTRCTHRCEATEWGRTGHRDGRKGQWSVFSDRQIWWTRLKEQEAVSGGRFRMRTLRTWENKVTCKYTVIEITQPAVFLSNIRGKRG